MSTGEPSTTWSDLVTAGRRHAFVRQLACATVNHPYLDTAEITDFRPIYRVPGRRRNGSVTGHHRLRWLFGRLLLPLRDVVLSVIGIFLGDVSVTYRRNVVTGPPDGAALRFADANTVEQQSVNVTPLWLIWSPKQAILAKVVENAPTRLDILWTSETGGLPGIDVAHRTLTWRDNSAVTFEEDSWHVGSELP